MPGPKVETTSYLGAAGVAGAGVAIFGSLAGLRSRADFGWEK